MSLLFDLIIILASIGVIHTGKNVLKEFCPRLYRHSFFYYDVFLNRIINNLTGTSKCWNCGKRLRIKNFYSLYYLACSKECEDATKRLIKGMSWFSYEMKKNFPTKEELMKRNYIRSKIEGDHK